MTRKCTRCFVEMKKNGTVYLSHINIAFPSAPYFEYECPNCNKIELVKVVGP